MVIQNLGVSLGHRLHGLVHPYLDLSPVISEQRGRQVPSSSIFDFEVDRKEL